MTLTSKSLDKPDETRKFDNGELQLVEVEGSSIGRAVFQPGWKWSNDVKPVAGTKSCEVAHAAFVISGKMHVVMDDGTEGDVSTGDVISISPGHDAWVVGDEPCVMIDWTGSKNYAKPS